MKRFLIWILEGLLGLLGGLPQKEVQTDKPKVSIHVSQVRDTQPEPPVPEPPKPAPYQFTGTERKVIDEYLVDPRLNRDDQDPEPVEEDEEERPREELTPDTVLLHQIADQALYDYLHREGRL